jgi:hypothetical protein
MTGDSLQHSLGFRIDNEKIQEGNYSSMPACKPTFPLSWRLSQACHSVLALLILLVKKWQRTGGRLASSGGSGRIDITMASLLVYRK